MPSIKLGELLVKANVLQESQLRTALNEQKKRGGLLGDVLVTMSMLTEDLLMRALSRQLGVPVANLDAIQGVPAKVLAKLGKEHARNLHTVPLQLKDNGKTLIVAMAEPHNLEHLDTLRAVTGCRILAQLAPRSALHRAYQRFYEAAELSDFEDSFKVLDAQGQPRSPRASGGTPPASAAPRGAEPEPVDPDVLLRAVEEVQRGEVAAIKAMVELLIEKGVFTRDEYLSKVRR